MDPYASDVENKDTYGPTVTRESFVTTANHSTIVPEHAENNLTTPRAQWVVRSQQDTTLQQHHHP